MSETAAETKRMVTVAGTATSRGFVSGPVFLYVGDRDLALPEYRLPADKVGELETIMKETSPLVYAGDGINDAPVLARADVGVAMGALGSDAAIEAADVVIMDDDVRRLPLAVRIARKTVRIAKENVVFSLAVKAACLILGALGIAGMWVAIFADVGVMILAVLNSARALTVKNKRIN